MITTVTRLVFTFLLCISHAYAQVTTAPYFFEQTDAITVIFDATKGDGGLKGFTGDVYAHTGVITTESDDLKDWKYVVEDWPGDDAKIKMQRIDTDLYQLTMDVDQFYGFPANTVVLQLAFVFRNVDGLVTGRSADGSDVYVPVLAANAPLQTSLISPELDDIVVNPGEMINVKGVASQNANLSISDNDQVLAQANNSTELEFNLTVGDPGTHTVVFEASAGNVTSSKSFTYIVISSNPDREDPPAGTVDGINYISDTSVVLSLRAPGKQSVVVLGDFNNWQSSSDYLMKQSVDGNTFWLQINGLAPGEYYAYQYLIDGITKVADPYSELVLDPSNDQFIPFFTFPDLPAYPSGQDGILTLMKAGKEEFDWQHEFTAPTRDDLVIYELLLRDFLARHDYQTLIDTLDYLENLGINAIELMPVSEFEGNISWGYNPSFHMALDKYYGTPEDFKRFVDEAHRRGMAVIVDVVYNHAFSQSPLAQMYWDASNFRPAPDNPWLNVTPTHPFNVGYDFNHESEETVRFVDRVMKYWLEEYRLDGFRFDLSKGFTQRNSGSDVGAWSAYDASRIAILKHYADVVWETNPEAYVIMEHFGSNQEEEEMAEYRNGMMFWNKLTPEYNEASMGYNNDLRNVYFKNKGWDVPNLVSFMESHDEERLMFKNLQFGNSSGNYNIKDLSTALRRQELVSAFFYTVPGPKMLWQFGELGYQESINRCPNGTIDESCRTDVKPITWDFFQNPDRRRLYDVTRELIYLKTNYDIFETEDLQLQISNSTTKRIRLSGEDFDLIVIGNFGVQANSINPNFTQTGWWYDYFGGDSLNVSNTTMSISMQPGEYRLYTTTKIPRADDFTTSLDKREIVENDLKIFPNPGQRELLVSWTQKSPENMSIEIRNLLGQIVYENKLGRVSSGKQLVSMSPSLASGAYIISINSNKGNVARRKWIVE